MKHLKFFALAAALALAGCHGGTITETVGGTVIGLQSGAKVSLQDNGGDTITLSQNGGFTFPTALDVGTTYIVTVSAQPNGESCSVENEIGIIEQNIGDISSIVVNCVSSVSSSDDVHGTVTGLGSGTLTLTNNGVSTLAITSNGASVQAWSFPQALPIGTNYQVAILTQPAGQTCAITSGATGTISDTQPLAAVVISCQ